eukprot:g4574.t1
MSRTKRRGIGKFRFFTCFSGVSANDVETYSGINPVDVQQRRNDVIGKIVQRDMEVLENNHLHHNEPVGSDTATEEVHKTTKSKQEIDLETENSVLKAKIRELEDKRHHEKILIIFNIVEPPNTLDKSKQEFINVSNKGSFSKGNYPSDSFITQQESSKQEDGQHLLMLKECLETKESELHDLQLQLTSIKDEFLRFRHQSESNAEDYERKVESLSDQLLQMKTTSRGFPQRVTSSHGGTSICDESYSIDAEQSTIHESSMDEMEEYHKKIYQLTQSLRSLSIKQKDLQRRLVEAEEERDHFKSVTVDLQQQVDVSSPETCVQLRALIQELETEISRLEQDNEDLYNQVQSGSVPMSHGGLTEDGRSPSELQMISKSEELVDCSLDIMGEMANVASENELGISLSYVQYAGLLAAIQKAIKQFEEAKLSPDTTTNTLEVLDRSLNSSLSISAVRVRGPKGEGQKRIHQLRSMLKDKEASLQSLQGMLCELEEDIKGHQSLSVQQEVQLEYLKQQLSSPERVIQLTWEIENLKRKSEDNQRELKALRDLQDQQQQELAIQWQSKQQAVAEKLSQHHSLSTYSQQLDHVIEVHEALQSEKQELEDALQEAKNETEKTRKELGEQVEDLERQLKSERCRPRGLLSPQDCQEILDQLNLTQEALKGSTEFLVQFQDLLSAFYKLHELCKEWKTETEFAKNAFLEEMDFIKEKLKIAEGLKLRAEQEKSGLQEILSLTSETTSQEIINLQNQVQDLTTKLADKNEVLQQTMNKISQQDIQIHQLQQKLTNKESELDSEKQDLDKQFQTVLNERSLLEERVRNYKQVIAGLNKDLGSYDVRLKEATKQQESHLSSFRIEQEKREVLENTVQELKQQLIDFESHCARFDELEEAVEILMNQKQDLRSQLEDLRKQDKSKEQEISLLQEELNELKDKISEGVKERLSLQQQLSNAKQQLIDENANWEAEFSKIGDLEIPRDQWKQPVTTLVQHCETKVLQNCAKETEAKIEKMKLELEESVEKLNVLVMDGKHQLQDVEEENWNLQEKIENLQNEMKHRESSLRQEITELKVSSEGRISELMEELKETKSLYDELEQESQEIVEQWKTQLEEKTQQMSEVQEKARELMQEKEKEITQLKQPRIPVITEITPASSDDDNQSEMELDPDQSTIHRLKNEVLNLKKSLADSEYTHELRDRACQVLKAEIQECQRSKQRENVDMEYVKNVLVNAFENDTLPKSSPMLMVLARLLHFSPEEIERIKKTPISTPRSSPWPFL